MEERVLTKIGKVTFKNPIWVASGTFGYSQKYYHLREIKKLGALTPKTITLRAREGNPPPRIAETPSGMLNAIGIENPGVDGFIETKLAALKEIGSPLIISILGYSDQEFIAITKKLNKAKGVSAIELNLSCPNVSHKGAKNLLFAQDPKATEKIVSAVRRKVKCPLIVKLTPNVTDIATIARAAEAGGADAVSLVNTYFGMAVDAEEMKPELGNVTGGLSGPAVKPLALKAVWEVYNSTKIPVVGIGGIMTGLDAAEFMLCGARAVQVGTANFVDPGAYTKILKEFKAYFERKKIKKASELVGKLKV